MTVIKICGIKEVAHAQAIAEAGADIIGLVFAASPRQITGAQARKICAAVKETRSNPQVAGVFVNTPASTIRKTAETCGFDWVQLSGDEPWQFCRELGLPVIKALRIERTYQPEQICNILEYGNRIMAQLKHIFLLDSNTGGKYGGSGTRFDWNKASMIAGRLPVVLAGGLTPDNVKEAIKTVRPWGVDVSSGVETQGVKDMEKIKKFIVAVREADASCS